MPKRLHRRMIVAGILLGALSGAAQAGQPAPAGPVAEPPVLTVDEVLARAEELDGKTVRLAGWASIGFEDYGLWASREARVANDWRQCVSLLNQYKDRSRNAALNGRMVTLTGVVDADIYHREDGQVVVLLGRCNRTGIRFIDETLQATAPAVVSPQP